MANEKRPSLAGSIFGMKCPRCRTGKLFTTPVFSYRKIFDMPDRCPVCNQKFMPEPGFYYGAMFISYGIWGWMSLAIVGGLMWFGGLGVNASFGVLILLSAILFPWIFRISRSVWIHINVKYRGVPEEQKV